MEGLSKHDMEVCKRIALISGIFRLHEGKPLEELITSIGEFLVQREAEASREAFEEGGIWMRRQMDDRGQYYENVNHYLKSLGLVPENYKG